MKHITTIEDLRQVHKRKVPKAFFDYADRGSYSEDTLRANVDDLQAIKFRQRILVDVSRRDLSTTILGEPAAMPLILAPVGLTGMQYSDGEIHACRAAQAAGIPYTLSTMSICSIEDVAANVAGNNLRGRLAVVPGEVPQIEGRLDSDALDVAGLIAYVAGLGAPAGEQQQRVDEQRLAGAGFAGDDGHAGAERDLRFRDDREIFDVEGFQHGMNELERRRTLARGCEAAKVEYSDVPVGLCIRCAAPI